MVILRFLHFVMLIHERIHLNIVIQADELRKNEESTCNGGQESNKFDPLDVSLSEVDRAQLRELDIFEANSNKFCEVEGKVYLLF